MRTLVVLGGNPVFTAPAEVPFAEVVEAVPETLYLGLHDDETGSRCDWLVPQLHDFERWGDARAYDGTVSFVQPVIRPLFGGHTVDEVLALFAGLRDPATGTVPDGRTLLRGYWHGRFGGGAEVLAVGGAPAAASRVARSRCRRGQRRTAGVRTAGVQTAVRRRRCERRQCERR